MKNEGSQKGEVCHQLFELLLNQKHKKKVDAMVQAESVQASPSVDRLLKLYIKQVGLKDTLVSRQHIEQMLLVGLKSDFYVKDGVLVAPEYKFDITKPLFRIKGFMDKPVIKGKTMLIDDFKTAKQKFKGEEEESNIQALFYSYAAKQIWPKLKPIVRFIFLQYPENPMMELEFSDETLKGFEAYLAHIQERVNVFNEKTSKSSFAADQVPHDQGFNGKLLCGFAKHPDQKKKDGTKMWHCPYKFAFDYYVVKNGEKIVSTTFKEDDVKLKKGETYQKLHYSGCPKFKNVMDELGAPVSKKETKKYTNVMDDF